MNKILLSMTIEIPFKMTKFNIFRTTAATQRPKVIHKHPKKSEILICNQNHNFSLKLHYVIQQSLDICDYLNLLKLHKILNSVSLATFQMLKAIPMAGDYCNGQCKYRIFLLDNAGLKNHCHISSQLIKKQFHEFLWHLSHWGMPKPSP